MNRHPRAQQQSFLNLFLAVVLAAIVTGCASSGGALSPQNTTVAIGAAQAAVTQARSTAAQLLDAQKISSADAANVQKQADTAREGIELARAIAATDPAGSQSKLAAAMEIAQALQRYLAAKQATAPPKP